MVSQIERLQQQRKQQLQLQRKQQRQIQQEVLRKGQEAVQQKQQQQKAIEKQKEISKKIKQSSEVKKVENAIEKQKETIKFLEDKIKETKKKEKELKQKRKERGGTIVHLYRANVQIGIRKKAEIELRKAKENLSNLKNTKNVVQSYLISGRDVDASKISSQVSKEVMSKSEISSYLQKVRSLEEKEESAKEDRKQRQEKFAKEQKELEEKFSKGSIKNVKRDESGAIVSYELPPKKQDQPYSYSSDLLKKSFRSKAEMKKAEQEYKSKQIGKDFFSFPKYSSAAEYFQAEVMKQPTKPTIKAETQRYESFGYSQKEAEILAKESVVKGGVTFTPEGAKQVTSKVDLSNVGGDFQGMDMGTFSPFGTEVGGAKGLSMVGASEEQDGTDSVLLGVSDSDVSRQLNATDSGSSWFRNLFGGKEDFKSGQEAYLPTSGVISAYNPADWTPEAIVQSKKDTSLTFWEATKGGIGDIFYNIGLGFSSTDYQVKQKEFKDPFSGFERVGKTEAEKEVTFVIPQFGTDTGKEVVQKTTILELETKKYNERERIINTAKNKYQEQLNNFALDLEKDINKEKITYEQAQEKLTAKTEEINKKFEEDYFKVYKKYTPDISIYQQSGRIIPTATNIALDVGVTALGGINPAIPISYFSAKGIYAASRDRQSEATFNLAFAGVSAGIGGKVVAKQITKIRLDELKSIPFSFTNKEIVKKEGKTLIRISASKSTGLASAETDLLIPIKQLKNGQFQILTGKGTAKMRVVDYARQGTMRDKYAWVEGFPFQEYKLVSRGKEKEILKKTITFTTAGGGTTRGAVIQTPYGVITLTEEQLFASQGYGYLAITGEGTTSPLYFGSIARKTDTGFDILGGSLKKARVYKDDFRFTGLFKRENVGEYIKNQEKEVLETFGVKTSGKKSSKKYFDELYSTDKSTKQIPRGFSKQEFQLGGFGETISKKIEQKLSKDISKQIAKSTIRSSSKNFSSVILGSGIKEKIKQKPIITTKSKQEILQQKKLNEIIGTTQILKPMIKESTDINEILGTSQLSILSQKLSSKKVTRQIIIPIISPNFNFGIPTTTPKIKPPIPTFEEQRQQERLAKQPTNLFVKSGGKFKKITKKPIQRNVARDMGFYIVDNTLSRQFKLSKAKGKAQKPSFNVPTNYGRIFGFKFRGYKVKKGVKKPLQNRYIEKKSYVGDTPSELRKLNVAKFIAQQKRKTPKTKPVNIGAGLLRGF